MNRSWSPALEEAVDPGSALSTEQRPHPEKKTEPSFSHWFPSTVRSAVANACPLVEMNQTVARSSTNWTFKKLLIRFSFHTFAISSR
ncbi:hypothetical protein H920_12924 [Fukomys damarensis]|uniref:Uncharacterized protein n=1 Tax=Fukomys damarensis TaxID=885580 RepID=A0A091D5P3_FUKDA|nr:hypothetical protein H920_12924 [Fukomys damarensis]